MTLDDLVDQAGLPSQRNNNVLENDVEERSRWRHPGKWTLKAE